MRFFSLMVTFLLLFAVLTINAQKVYLNNKWKETTADKATYYRTIDTLGSALFGVKDYFITGQLQMQGYVSDIKKWERQGEWYWLNDKGDTTAVRNYKDNEQHGLVKVFNPPDTLSFMGYHHMGKRDSLWCWFTPEGLPKTTGYYKGGQMCGDWYYYYPVIRDSATTLPVVKTIQHYEQGKRQGRYANYNTHGIITVAGDYHNGKKDGLWKYYGWVKKEIVETNQNGDTTRYSKKNCNYLREEINYLDDKKHGKSVQYATDSTVSQISFYTFGEPSGQWQKFDHGVQRAEINYLKKREGNYWLSVDDSLNFTVPFKRNRMHGTSITYYPDSTVFGMATFKRGYLTGTAYKYDTLGNPVDTSFFPKHHRSRPLSPKRTFISPPVTRFKNSRTVLSGFKAGKRQRPTIYSNYAKRSDQKAIFTLADDDFEMLKDNNEITYYKKKMYDDALAMNQMQRAGREEIEEMLGLSLDAKVATMLVMDDLLGTTKINVWAVPVSIDTAKRLAPIDSIYVKPIGIYFHELTEGHLTSEMKIVRQDTRWFRDGLAEYASYRAIVALAPRHNTLIWEDLTKNYEKINCKADLYHWIGTGRRGTYEGVKGNRGFYDAAFFFFYDLVNEYGDEILAETLQRLGSVRKPSKTITGDYILAVMGELTGEDMRARLDTY